MCEFFCAYFRICSSRLITYSLLMTSRKNAYHSINTGINKQHEVKHWNIQLITISYSHWVQIQCASYWSANTKDVLTSSTYSLVEPMWDIAICVSVLVIPAQTARHFYWTLEELHACILIHIKQDLLTEIKILKIKLWNMQWVNFCS